VLFNMHQHRAAGVCLRPQTQVGRARGRARRWHAAASQAVSRTTNAIPAQEMPTIRHI